MSKFNNNPKPLKGGDSMLSDFDNIESILLNSINNGAELNNVNITGGTIDGTVIGGNNPSSGTFTNLNILQNTSTNTLSNLTSITFLNNSSISEINNDLTIDSSGGNVVIQDTLQVNNNTIISGDLTVLGTINQVPITPPLGMSIENISTALGISLNCSNLINISFLGFTGSGTSTGTLNTGVFDGFFKIISIVVLPTGGEYHLTVNNLLDPGSSIVSNKVLKFKYSGQSITLVYSLSKNCYTSIFGGTV